jgi:hypothetical protein
MVNMANDELYTPKWIFDKLNVVFDLDVCAPSGGPLHTPTLDYYDLEADGLTAKWFGRVWMNPPFSKPSVWVERWLNHQNGLALLPLSGNSRWWSQLWNSHCAVVQVPPNTGFINSKGDQQKIMYGISLWAIGETNITALKDSGIGKLR